MGLEIEAKFRVDDDQIFPSLIRLRRLGRFQLSPDPAPEQQRNTYFDSSDGRLNAQEYSLRVREVGGQRTATLKRTRERHGSLRIRDEWQAAVGPSDDPRDWPDGELRDLALAALGGSEIEPLFVIETRRQHIKAMREGQSVADLCLDDSLARVGPYEERICELEVELLDMDQRPAFDLLIALLRLSFPLFPEERSKKARGLALRTRALDQALEVGS